MKKEKALNIAAGLCSKKEQCSDEIRRKLQKWELTETEIEEILCFLQKHQFIDDTRYAQAYAEDKFRFNHWGKQKIALMLHRKKIDAASIAQALENLNEENYTEACLSLLKQKMKILPAEDPYRRRAKLIRFALGRGFDYELIQQCLTQLFENPEEAATEIDFED